LETALYLPVKRFLEKLGFTVKGEVGGCDLVALSGDDPPVVVIGELKLSFNLELVLQAVDRAGAADEVWLAAKLSARGKGRESDARYRNLCRRLGFGMLAVTNTGDVEVIVKPATTAPRRNPKKRSRLVSEHQRRKGDPALGGFVLEHGHESRDIGGRRRLDRFDGNLCARGLGEIRELTAVDARRHRQSQHQHRDAAEAPALAGRRRMRAPKARAGLHRIPRRRGDPDPATWARAACPMEWNMCFAAVSRRAVRSRC